MILTVWFFSNDNFESNIKLELREIIKIWKKFLKEQEIRFFLCKISSKSDQNCDFGISLKRKRVLGKMYDFYSSNLNEQCFYRCHFYTNWAKMLGLGLNGKEFNVYQLFRRFLCEIWRLAKTLHVFVMFWFSLCYFFNFFPLFSIKCRLFFKKSVRKINYGKLSLIQN